jgi:hypothetical protein
MRKIAAGMLLSCIFGVPAHGDAMTARSLLKQALADSAGKDSGAAYEAVQKAIGDPGFASLDTGAQHAALELAYVSAYGNKDFGLAHQFSSRATALPQQSAADWRYRLSSAARISDGPDEALCIVSLMDLSGVNADGITLEAVRRAYSDTKLPEFAKSRQELLLALYDHRWRPAEGISASDMWRTLSLMLLEGNETAKAAQVVTLVDEPADVIAMQADRRYERLLKSPYFESNAHRAAQSRINVLRGWWNQHPRSLAALLRLTRSLLDSREDDEVLALTTRADQMIVSSPPSSPPFDDVEKNYAWILNAKSDSLRHLGRFDDAVNELRRSLTVPRVDKVSQAINLAALFCELSRPDEALSVLPKMEDASDYGKIQIARIELTVATEKGDTAGIQKSLGYLGEHQEVSPATYQQALLIAGESGKAEAFLISRLTDPEKRTAALMALQTYADSKRPPKAQAWHVANEQLKATPAIQRAIAEVGFVKRYTWRYD